MIRMFGKKAFMTVLSFALSAVFILPLVLDIAIPKGINTALAVIVSVFGLASSVVPFFYHFASIRISTFFACAIFLYSLSAGILGVWGTESQILQSLLGLLVMLFIGLFFISIKKEFLVVDKSKFFIIPAFVIIQIVVFVTIDGIVMHGQYIFENIAEAVVFCFFFYEATLLLFRKATSVYLFASVTLISTAMYLIFFVTEVLFFGNSFYQIDKMNVVQNANLAGLAMVAFGIALYSKHLVHQAKLDAQKLGAQNTEQIQQKSIPPYIAEGYMQIDASKLVVIECSESANQMLNASSVMAIGLKNNDPLGLIKIVNDTVGMNRVLTNKLLVGDRIIEIKSTPSHVAGHSRVLLLTRDITEKEKQVLAQAKRSRILEMLVEVANAANRLDDINQICQYSISAVLETLDFEMGVIIVFDEKTGKLHLQSPVGFPMPSYAPGMGDKNSLGRSLAFNSLMSRREVVSEDITKEANLNKYMMLKSIGIRSLIIMPFSIKTDTQGCLFLASTKPMKLPHEDVQMLRTIATQMGMTIERDMLMQSLHEKVKELEISSKNKDNLITMVSHELKTPLTSIVGYVELLEINNSNLTHDQRDFVNIMHHQSDNLSWLIIGISLLTMLKTGKYVIEYRSIDVEILLSEIQRRFVKPYEVNTKVRFSSCNIGTVRSDRTAMVNICANLVHAFQRFADPDAIIDFTITKSGSMLAIKVSDNSKPLDRAELERIYELFSTIPTKPSTGNKGSVGLPLSLVREFTLLLGGSLWFDAGENGNTATVEIPIADWQP